MGGILVESGGQPPEFIEASDQSFDDIALSVEPGIKPRTWSTLASPFSLGQHPSGNHRPNPSPTQIVPQRPRIIAAISKQLSGATTRTSPSGVQVHGGQQRLDILDLLLVPGDQGGCQRHPVAIAQQMDLGGQPTATAAYSLGSRRGRAPFFRAPVPARLTRTYVASAIQVSRSISPWVSRRRCRRLSSASNSPARCHR